MSTGSFERRSRARRKLRGHARSLRLEALEDRRLLAAAGLVDLLSAGDVGRYSSAGVSAAIGVSSAVYPLNSIPQLHSSPGAPATLYLDFNGHFQSTWGFYRNITTPVYDTDGDEATFSADELTFIQNVWQVVAEDYAPFNINVTTVEPAVLAPGVSDSAANGVALRVAIGGLSSDWFGSADGVAQKNSFTNSIANVAYVFAEGKTDFIRYGRITSHEAGHSFGLDHQRQGYRPGFDWTAIMATSNIGSPAVWHNGVADTGSTQDDIATIARSTNLFGFRPDDHAATTSGATPLAGGGTSFTGSGIIGSATDVDIFLLTTSQPQSLRVSLDGDAIEQNLDAVVELRDASGAVLVSANPTDSPDAFVVADTAQPVYIAVRSTGEYGRLGQYTLTVSESLPGVRITTTGGPFTTSETGRSESVTFVLDARPTDDVTFNIASSDTSEGIVSASSLVFTPGNWYVPQTVTIAGVSDELVDGTVGYSVLIAPAISLDPAYTGFDPDDLAVVNLDDAPGKLYWGEHFPEPPVGYIRSSSLAGEGTETLIDIGAVFGTTTWAADIVLDPQRGKMYWTEPGSDAIRRANLDGSAPATVLSGLDTPLAIAIDSGNARLYWVDLGTKKIQRANLDGTGVEDLVTTGIVNPVELKLDLAAGKIYWSDSSNFTISRANLDGSQIEIVLHTSGAAYPYGLELDAASGKMYYSLRDASTFHGSLYRSDLDGANPEFLVDISSLNPAYPRATVTAIEIDDATRRIYVMTAYSYLMWIYSAELDGSSVALVADRLVGAGAAGTGYSRALAVLSPTPGFTVTPTSGLVTTETGGAAAFTVVLNARPSADVVIPLSSNDTTEGSVSPSSLTFTPANWDEPQTVVVTGVDDATYDQDVTYTVVLGAAASSDPAYHGLNPADVAVINLDNDLPPTKFYVVDDASTNRTYEYGSTGTAVENYALNSGNSAPRGAASSIAGDKVWIVDANRKVYVYDTTGGLLGSWTLGSLASNATVEGIATNGTDVWIVDARSDKVFKYTGAASRTSGSENAASSFNLNSGNTSPKDIVTNGTNLWVVNDSSTNKVFKYTVAGSLVGSWTISGANTTPTGITIDPANVSDIWIVDSGTDRVYQYTGAASRTSGSQSAAGSFALAAGNTNPQGIADPPALAAQAGDGARVNSHAFHVTDRSFELWASHNNNRLISTRRTPEGRQLTSTSRVSPLVNSHVVPIADSSPEPRDENPTNGSHRLLSDERWAHCVDEAFLLEALSGSWSGIEQHV